jgi:hypothetical protein
LAGNFVKHRIFKRSGKSLNRLIGQLTHESNDRAGIKAGAQESTEWNVASKMDVDGIGELFF